MTDAADLERSNRALSEAAYLIAHDLAEPLRAVSGFAGLLERRYAGRLDEAADEYLAHIAAGTRRMEAMLRGLSEYVASERASLEPQEVDMGALVGELAAARPHLGHITIGDLPAVRADRPLLRDLVARVLDNAAKFRAEGAAQVDVWGERAGEQVLVAVADRGIGVPAGEEEIVVKLFRRASNAAEHAGAGVGLAVSERIAQRHGGRLELERRREGGLVVWVALPAGWGPC